MRVNFLTDLKSDTGTLVFLCFKNQSFDKYLNNLNKKIKGYIDKAIKVSSMCSIVAGETFDNSGGGFGLGGSPKGGGGAYSCCFGGGPFGGGGASEIIGLPPISINGLGLK